MRVTVEWADLHRALGAATRATTNRPTMPTLSGVLIRAAGDRLTVTGTDMEVAIEATVPARVDEEGAVVLPARTLAEIVRRFGEDDDVRLEVGERLRADIRWGRSRVALNGMSPTHFPSIGAVGEAAEATIIVLDGADFRALVRRTTFAVSDDITRPVLTGVLFEWDGETLTATATDAFRVAFARARGSGTGPLQGGKVVPEKALAEAARIAEDDGQVRLVFRDALASITTGDVRVVTRLIDGSYPEIAGVLPAEYPTRLYVDRAELLEAIERASLVAGGGIGRVKKVVRLAIEAGRIVLTANDAELGEAREELEAELNGEATRIAFNPQYLVQGLRVIGAERVEIGLVEPLKPARFVGVGETGFEYVALPVKAD